ncbi:ABC transporter substrate-binding protein [Erythrobacter arachoides]|uniref:ABC transporter substrate-binding protein n=1 Tax=Aurantiacibacter arachoides TaxID=1850444 RepID=A0A844ZZX1_9SPHN|nr:ABC transporter substrate-binding protein [Aurantiacibacter arachoides]
MLLLAGGCAAAPPHFAGDRATIVSLNPCADAILAEVAAPGQLLAISHYSKDPAASSMEAGQAARFPATGGTAEEVIALAPDMVVADIFLAPATRAALEGAGIRVETVGIVSDLDQSLTQIRQLVALTGEGARGETLAARMTEAWEASAFDGPPIDTLLWQEGGIVPGEATLAANLLAHTGFALHSAARGLGQGAYLPLEQVLADPPELVLAAGDERMLSHPVLGRVDGLRYERLDGNLLFCGGPTIPRALARLRAIRAQAG